MSSQRNTGAFIIGGVLGGLVGAAVTLWNTPKSGDELRAMLSGDGSTSQRVNVTGDTSPDHTTTTGRFSNPVLSFVEKAAAPIVGVELGKLAKDDPDATRLTPVRASAADARPPSQLRDREGIDATPAATDTSTDVQSPDEEITHDDNEGSSAHAATVDELTTPPPDEQATGSVAATDAKSGLTDFPDLPSDKAP